MSDEAKKLGERLKEYGRAAHDAFKKGDLDQADKLWKKVEETIDELLKAKGLS